MNTKTQPRTFTQTVESLRFGTLSDELTDSMRDLVAACATTGRAGKLTLELTLKPGKGGQIEVFDDVKVKLPKSEKGSSLMWATLENNLARNDPRQMEIEGLRRVDTSPGAEQLRRVDPATGEIQAAG